MKYAYIIIIVVCFYSCCYNRKADVKITDGTNIKLETILIKCVDLIPSEYREEIYSAFFLTTLHRNLILLHQVVNNQYIDEYGCPDQILSEKYNILIYRDYQRKFLDCPFKEQFYTLAQKLNLKDRKSGGKIIEDFVYVFDITDGIPKIYEDNNMDIVSLFRNLYADSMYVKDDKSL